MARYSAQIAAEASRRLAVLDSDPTFIKQLVSASNRLDWEIIPLDQNANDFVADARALCFAVDICPDGRPRVDRIAAIQEAVPNARVVGVTLYPSLSLAVSAVKAGAIDCLAKPIDASELFASFDTPSENLDDNGSSSLPSLARVEWDYIARVLKRVGGNLSKASRILKIQRSTLQRKLKKYPPQW